MELEDQLRKTPLTRGVGIKPIKITKPLIGTNSIYGAIETSQRQARHPLLRSPERV